MKRRRIAVSMAVTTVVLGSTAALSAPSAFASSAANIRLLRIGTLEVTSTLNMAKDSHGLFITGLALDTLETLGPEGQLEPSLATSVTQPNPATYVYHLRRGVKFWDGDELTSTDVAFSLNLLRAPGSEMTPSFSSNLKSITTNGPYTVVVTLSRPDASWQYDPTSLGIFEKKFYEDHTASFGNPGTLIMGSGPWEVDSLDSTTGAELSANPNWWGGKVNVQHISVKFFYNSNTEALAFRSGEIDFDPLIVGPKSFAAASGANMLNVPSCTLDSFAMNTQASGWADVHVRRAAAYALDRTDIVAANGGYATPLYTLVTPQELRTVASTARVDSLLSSLDLYPYNLAKARQQMAESAYPHGFSTTLLEYNYGATVDITQVIAAELAKIGIDAHIKVTPTTSAWVSAETAVPASQRPSNFSLGGCTSPDISSGLEYELGSWDAKQGAWNMADYTPPEVDKLLNEGVATSNKATRFQVYSKLLQQLAQDVPYVPLYLQDDSAAISNKFSFPGFNQYSTNGAYPLGLRPA